MKRGASTILTAGRQPPDSPVDADFGFIPWLKGFVNGVADGDATGATAAPRSERLAPPCDDGSAAVAAEDPCGPRRGVLPDRRGETVPARLESRYPVGTLPQGFPPLTFLSYVGLDSRSRSEEQASRLSHWPTIATSSAFAGEDWPDVDGSQEMVGIGTANIAAGLFQGFPSAQAAHAQPLRNRRVPATLTGHRGQRNHTDVFTRSRTASNPPQPTSRPSP